MNTEFEESVIEEQQITPMYSVLMHNDDVTTMDFVVLVLESVFQHAVQEATRLMQLIHTSGAAIAGVYPYDIAATKAAQVHRLAAEGGYPLRCTVETHYES